MKNSLREEPEFTKNRNESMVSESIKSVQEEIKENRKFINYLLRTLSQKKNLPSEILSKECMEILRNCEKDITKLVDEDRNNCMYYI
jgi:hypothetical protein